MLIELEISDVVMLNNVVFEIENRLVCYLL